MIPSEQAREEAARALEAEVRRRDEWYGLDNWSFDEVAGVALAAAFPVLVEEIAARLFDHADNAGSLEGRASIAHAADLIRDEFGADRG